MSLEDAPPADQFVPPPGEKYTADPTPESKCVHCAQTWRDIEALPLTRLCEHAQNVDRFFADIVRHRTLKDGRVQIQLDMPPELGGANVVCVIGPREAEALRAQLGHPGASAMAQRWRN